MCGRTAYSSKPLHSVAMCNSNRQVYRLTTAQDHNIITYSQPHNKANKPQGGGSTTTIHTTPVSCEVASLKKQIKKCGGIKYSSKPPHSVAMRNNNLRVYRLTTTPEHNSILLTPHNEANDCKAERQPLLITLPRSL
jgi:hypothetical protein